jgi:hypothetical protein
MRSPPQRSTEKFASGSIPYVQCRWQDRQRASRGPGATATSRRRSTPFNTLQHLRLAALKGVEHYPQLPSEPPLKGGRRVAAGGSCWALSEA